MAGQQSMSRFVTATAGVPKKPPVAASAFSAFAYGAQGGGGGGDSNANAQAKENEGGDEEKDLSAKRRKTSDGDGGGNGGGSNAPGQPTSPASPGKRAGVLSNDDFDEESPVVVVAAKAGAGRGGAAASKKGRALLSDDDDDEVEVEVEVEEVVDLTGSDGDEGEEGGGVAPSKLAARPLSPAPKQGGGKEEEEAAVVRLPSNDYDDGDDDLEGEEDDDEDEEEQEEAKDVVAQCERVAADLRKALGLAQGADRVNATGEDGGGGGGGGDGGGGESGGESGSGSGGGGLSGLAAAAPRSDGGAPPPLTSSSSSSPPTPTSGIMTAAEIAAAAGHADSGACLRLFQVVGVNFLLLLDSHRCRGGERGSGGSGRGGELNTTSASDKGSGCIVADEMGLGKTAQCCTFLAVRRARLRAVAEAAEAEAERARDAARKKVVGDRNDDGDGGDDGVFSSDEEELEANDPAARRASARAAEAREAASRPALVVVPSSLADNWLRELAVFAPRLRVLRFHASADRKQAMRDFGRGRRAVEALRGDGENGENGIDVILTTYPLFESSGADAKDARSWLKKIPLGVLALDEAHAVKAGAAVSARARRLGELSEGAAMRVFLTGTPLQNKLGELKTLLAFLLPGFDWEQLADDDDDDDGEDESKSQRSSEQAARLRKALAPFCLRRLKSEVAKQLPPKTREDVVLELQGEQRRAYDSALRAFAAKINNNNNAKTAATRNGDVVVNGDDDGENGGGDENASESSEALRLLRSMPAKALASSFTHLRKLANQPLLVRGGHFFDAAKVEELARASAALGLFGDGAGMSTPPGAGESGGDALLSRIREELSGYSDLDLHSLAVSGGRRTRHLLLPSTAPLRASAKSARLAELLPRLQAQGSRVLLFSQWLGCLDVLGMLLDHLGLSWSRLDGSTPVAERMALVDEFNGNSSRSGEKQQQNNNNNNNSKTKPPPFAMLLSTRAGGQGLNLTGADTVIFHDVGFNPSVERQGEDRAHRLGQRRPVKVYRLVSEGTVDEGIVELARRKAALGDAVMGENGEGGEGGEASASSGEKEGMAQLLMQALQKVQGGGGAGG